MKLSIYHKINLIPPQITTCTQSPHTISDTITGASHTFCGLKGQTLIVHPGELAGSEGSDYFLKDLEVIYREREREVFICS
jgi:hypothetical protein